MFGHYKSVCDSYCILLIECQIAVWKIIIIVVGGLLFLFIVICVIVKIVITILVSYQVKGERGGGGWSLSINCILHQKCIIAVSLGFPSFFFLFKKKQNYVELKRWEKELKEVNFSKVRKRVDRLSSHIIVTLFITE